LDNKKSEKKKVKKKLVKEFDELEEETLSLEDEQKLIDSQEKVLAEEQSKAKGKKTELAEKERKRKEEEEKAKQQREQQQKEQQKQRQKEEQNEKEQIEPEQKEEKETSSGSSSTASLSSISSNKETYGKGGFIWPVDNYRTTSEFGSRTHPIQGTVKQHNGLDLAPPSPGQQVPVHAAASGVVTSAGPLGGFGNVVMISHGDVTTLYAHLSSVSVSTGDSIDQGSQLGVMGNTGNSKGVHLHFEVHPGGYKNPTNPRGYLP